MVYLRRDVKVHAYPANKVHIHLTARADTDHAQGTGRLSAPPLAFPDVAGGCGISGSESGWR